MRLLALDQALANTGWSVLELGSTVKVECGCFQTDNTLSDEDRMARVAEFVLALVDHYDVERVFTERTFVDHVNPGRSETLVRTQAGIHLLLKLAGIPFEVIVANAREHSSWRRALGLPNGKMAARTFLQLTPKFIPVKDGLEHACEAVCLGLGALVHRGIIDLNQVGLQISHVRFSPPRFPHYQLQPLRSLQQVSPLLPTSIR